MSRNQPASAEQREAYRQQLPPKSQRVFDRLVNLMANKNTRLPWYHQVGSQVLKLRELHGEGTRWLERLGEAVGFRVSSLQKACRLVALYPMDADLDPLLKMGIDWVWLYVTFPIKDADDRHKFLQEARHKGWTIEEIRAKVQQLIHSSRGGVGGPTRRKIRPQSAAFTLRQMQSKTRYWLDYYEGSWTKLTDNKFRGLMKSMEGEALEELLSQVVDTFGEMAQASKAALGDAKDMLAQSRSRNGAKKP